MATTRKSVRDIYQQLRKDVLGAWLDLPNLIRDRRRILADPATIYRRPKVLKNGPLQFAAQALLLPTALLGGISAFVSFVIDPPPPQAERAVQVQGNLEKVLKDAETTFGKKTDPAASSPFGNLSEKELNELIDLKVKRIEALKKQQQPGQRSEALEQEVVLVLDAMKVRTDRSIADLAVQLGKAAQESKENQALLKSIGKLNETESQFRPMIIGVGLALNSLFFAKLVRRRFPAESWTDEIHTAHLYIVAACLGPVTALAGLLGIVLEYAVRYDVDWYLESHNSIMGVIGIWGLFQLRSAARRLSLLRPRVDSGAKAATAVANRLFLSNLATQVLVLTVTSLLGALIFHVVYSRFLSA